MSLEEGVRMENVNSTGYIPLSSQFKLFEEDPVYDQINDGTNRQEGALSPQNYQTIMPLSVNENLKLEKKSLLESGPYDRLDRTPKPALKETVYNPYVTDPSST